MMRKLFRVGSLFVLVLAATAHAQSSQSQQAPPPPQPPVINSHQVNPDGSITFRYSNAGATSVSVASDFAIDPLPMHRDAATGLWTLTTKPLPPEHYGYSFVIDGGVPELDPLNHVLRPNIVGLYSDVLVPGHPPMPWEMTAIPHGQLDTHTYTTHVALNLPGNQEPYIVYTPPGYDPHRKQGYPVLYLLHGWTDTAVGWTAVGRAQWMLDEMIDSGKAVPMIVVMPMGYGNYDFVTSGPQVWGERAKVDQNVTLYSEMLRTEVMPAIEREYDVAPGRENRAIAGLSMGGLESLSIGVRHSDLFAWVGGFSAAPFGDLDAEFPGVTAQKENLRLLWVACGTQDHLYQNNQNFIAWARTKGLPVTAISTPGWHTWLVWRDNLLHFAPLLFR